MTLASVKMNRVTRAFDDPELEQGFLDDYVDSVRSQSRAAWIAGAAMLAISVAPDPPTPLGFAMRSVRYGLGAPAEILGLGVAFASSATFRCAWVPVNCCAAAAAVVAMLNRLFTAFDDLADEHGLEKIKTIA
jgi:hypothetical protein